MELLSIAELKRLAQSGRLEAAVHGQVEMIAKKETRDQKPFWELILADAEAKLTLRAWSDSPNFGQCADLEKGAFLEITGDFAFNAPFGVEAKRWNCRSLDIAEVEALLRGPTALRTKQDADFVFVENTVSGIGDPRLRLVGIAFLAEHGERFRRTAAARNYHHSRRGGLVEHTAQMMRSACAIAAVYPNLNRDLLVAGVLFHDSGKLWENVFAETGFIMPFSERGELIGHITIGIELVNTIWRKVQAGPDAAGWVALKPASEDVRLHLLHLIAAHHGAKEYGSPVDPKTPEAYALHHIDNLDAKLEMIFAGYETSPLLGPRVFDRVRPLPGNLVQQLPKMLEPGCPHPDHA